ncbi:choline dehydrogenase [Spectribacter hydrogenoxidans]|uniref:Choline dehydrogenase n=1 Tax=Spectribacter hydrogenoxidans TaxID=3075608 RepID=A0ABU3C4E1_9GAMM|nr:choline dehydrogenase [Salinisphaera sp. W335]MDT0636382.1 choline dehydrogenase [Salinisphaera sp. W335]
MYDYVIVGAGSAGCALANRLSADPSISVCLLEAGKRDRSPLVHIPLGVAGIMPTRHANWAFQTEPQPGLGDRRGYQPRGKVLGGSSSINAMIYIRGHRSDYDAWSQEGNPGWSFDEVLPYFKRSENQERGANEHHGIGGPLNVADLRSPHAICESFIAAGQQKGYARIEDFNGPDITEGVGYYQVTQQEGARCSAATAFLTPILDRPNLTVVTEAHATRVLFDGKRATGVRYRKNDQGHEITANREVILSAGALQSPQLLMLSGIGPRDELERHGIELRHELPGVGQNLQDHIDYVTAVTSPSKETIGLSVPGSWDMLRAMNDYRRYRIGKLTSNVAEAGGFLRSDPGIDVPDLQLHFVVTILDDHGRKLHAGHGYSCHVCLLRPKSRGRVGLHSANPMAAPVIDPGFLSEEEDMQKMVRGFKLMREILSAPALASYRGRDLYTADVRTDEEIREVIRQRADTVYHPIGTCRMGHDEGAVVDSELKVHGIDGLRVVDASVMPTIVSGNTNAPTIMIGEKASDMILFATRSSSSSREKEQSHQGSQPVWPVEATV